MEIKLVACPRQVYSLLQVTALALTARICQGVWGVSLLKNIKSLLPGAVRWIKKISAWNNSKILYRQLCVPSNSESQMLADFSSTQEEQLQTRIQRHPEPHQWGASCPREVHCSVTESTGLIFLPAAPSLSGTLYSLLCVAQLRWDSLFLLVRLLRQAPASFKFTARQDPNPVSAWARHFWVSQMARMTRALGVPGNGSIHQGGRQSWPAPQSGYTRCFRPWGREDAVVQVEVWFCAPTCMKQEPSMWMSAVWSGFLLTCTA